MKPSQYFMDSALSLAIPVSIKTKIKLLMIADVVGDVFDALLHPLLVQIKLLLACIQICYFGLEVGQSGRRLHRVASRSAAPKE